MSKKRLSLIAATILLALSTSTVNAATPALDLSTAATLGPPRATLFMGYDSSGFPFDQAVMIGGAVVDATITLGLTRWYEPLIASGTTFGEMVHVIVLSAAAAAAVLLRAPIRVNLRVPDPRG